VKGEIKAEGKLPVNVSDEYRVGSGIRQETTRAQ